MDLTPPAYERLHMEAFTDESFVVDITSDLKSVPSYATWNEFGPLLPSGTLLEVGPGTGHLLAAAKESGRDVFGVEASAVHRSFIKRNWGIDTVCATLDGLPKATRFGAIVLVNTIEHVYDVQGLMIALRNVLAPGGAILVSTANAGCVLVPLVGPYWAMFKPSDHVSIPSAEGLRRLARDTGMRAKRIWTGELPLETPVGLAVAARDYFRERVLRRVPAGVEASSPSTEPPKQPLPRRVMRHMVRTAESFDPTREVTARFGIAAAIRGLFVASEGARD